MRVLLTGASGFLGRYVLSQLTRQGIDVVVVGRSRPAVHGGDFIEADLLQKEDCSAAVQRARATHLIHLAWYAEHGNYWESPLNLRWLEGSIQLVEAFCSAGGRKVVAAGTCAEYDWSCGYCREDASPLAPASMYGTAKDATRRLAAVVCGAHQIAFAWGRIFLPYGQGEDSRRLIPSLIEVFQGRRLPFGVNAIAYRDFLHAEDVARGFLSLLLSDAAGNYNISSGQPTQIAEVVRLIASAFGGDASDVLDLSTERPSEPEMLIGDCQKLKALGWQPVHSIASIVASQGA
ncbi:MAG: NAD-dependent epimerase/dehydratase [Sulfuritalea sp.]|nr:NAD-dependent epimerase/dehydratase [Sulfuritalea sp.]